MTDFSAQSFFNSLLGLPPHPPNPPEGPTIPPQINWLAGRDHELGALSLPNPLDPSSTFVAKVTSLAAIIEQGESIAIHMGESGRVLEPELFAKAHMLTRELAVYELWRDGCRVPDVDWGRAVFGGEYVIKPDMWEREEGWTGRIDKVESVVEKGEGESETATVGDVEMQIDGGGGETVKEKKKRLPKRTVKDKDGFLVDADFLALMEADIQVPVIRATLEENHNSTNTVNLETARAFILPASGRFQSPPSNTLHSAPTNTYQSASYYSTGAQGSQQTQGEAINHDDDETDEEMTGMEDDSDSDSNWTVSTKSDDEEDEQVNDSDSDNLEYESGEDWNADEEEETQEEINHRNMQSIDSQGDYWLKALRRIYKNDSLTAENRLWAITCYPGLMPLIFAVSRVIQAEDYYVEDFEDLKKKELEIVDKIREQLKPKIAQLTEELTVLRAKAAVLDKRQAMLASGLADTKPSSLVTE